MSKIYKIFAVLFLILTAGLCQGASFDCKKSNTPVEKMICFDPSLSQLDEEMRAAYDQVKLDPLRRQELWETQKYWRNFRRNPCGSPECIKNSYLERIEELRSVDLSRALLSAQFATPNLKSQFSYLTPKNNGELDVWRQYLSTTKVLEESANTANRFLPATKGIELVASECGFANAFYYNHRVVLCYEFAKLFSKPFVLRASTESAPSESRENKRFFLLLEYVINHEIGHAVMHDKNGMDSLGQQETEADNFASVALLTKYTTPEDQSDLLWAVYSWMNSTSKSSYDVDDYSDDHDLPQQRLSHFSCNLAGANPYFFEKLKSSRLLSSRSKLDGCKNYWDKNLRAFQKIAERTQNVRP